jgi:hypothetical protein
MTADISSNSIHQGHTNYVKKIWCSCTVEEYIYKQVEAASA